MTSLINKITTPTLAAALALVPASFADGTIPSDLTPTGKRDRYAHEGFYASIRARYQSESLSDSSGISSTGVFGVQSTTELGGSLQGFLRYEATSAGAQGSALQTRLAHVGLRGSFGELQAGTVRPKSYRWVHGVTDVSNHRTNGIIGINTTLPVLQSKTLEYTTPDINGFQLAAFVVLDDERDAQGRVGTNVSRNPEEYDPLASPPEAFNYRMVFLFRDQIFGSQPFFFEAGQPPLLAQELGGIPFPTVSAEVIEITDPQTGNTLLIVDFGGNGFGASQYQFFLADGTPGTIPTLNDALVLNGQAAPPRSNPTDDNDIDLYSIAAKYAVHGFSVGAAALVRPDGVPNPDRPAGPFAYAFDEDLTMYTFSLSYEQDNWFVSGWAGEDNFGDSNLFINTTSAPSHRRKTLRDNQYASLATGVSIDNVNLYAIYDQMRPSAYSGSNQFLTLGAQYNFSERSRFWVEYAEQDLEVPEAAPNAPDEDYFVIGMRYDL